MGAKMTKKCPPNGPLSITKTRLGSKPWQDFCLQVYTQIYNSTIRKKIQIYDSFKLEAAMQQVDYSPKPRCRQ